MALAIVVRYAAAAARAAARCSLRRWPLSRAATTKLATRRLTSHSNGAAQRLVEVVEIEHDASIRRREHAEVRQVRVTAALHTQPRARRLREIRRHDRRATAVERERRDDHAPVADRHQLGHARRVLLLQDPDRVRTPVGGRPLAVRLQRHRLALGATLGHTRLDRLRQVQHASVAASCPWPASRASFDLTAAFVICLHLPPHGAFSSALVRVVADRTAAARAIPPRSRARSTRAPRATLPAGLPTARRRSRGRRRSAAVAAGCRGGSCRSALTSWRDEEVRESRSLEKRTPHRHSPLLKPRVI